MRIGGGAGRRRIKKDTDKKRGKGRGGERERNDTMKKWWAKRSFANEEGWKKGNQGWDPAAGMRKVGKK
jgi:hypothetical protein